MDSHSTATANKPLHIRTYKGYTHLGAINWEAIVSQLYKLELLAIGTYVE